MVSLEIIVATLEAVLYPVAITIDRLVLEVSANELG
jgi:hypothetical protein